MEGKEKRKAGDSSSSIQAEEEGDGWNKIRGLKAKVVCFNRKLVAVVVGERETRIEQKVDNTCTGGATATSCRRHGRQLILFFFFGFPFGGFCCLHVPLHFFVFFQWHICLLNKLPSYFIVDVCIEPNENETAIIIFVYVE